MTFRKRLRYYVVGLSMGLVVSFMFFKNRGCSWLPGNRVLDNISSSVILRDDSILCVMQCNHITDKDMFEMFYTGTVNFSESKTHDVFKTFVLSGTRSADKTPFKLAFHVVDSISYIVEVPGANTACDCPLPGSFKRVFMPDEMVKRIFAESSFSTTAVADEEMAKGKITREEVKKVLFDGEIDRTQSDPFAEPHPVYVVTKNNMTVKVELAEKMTRVLSVLKR